MSIKINTAIFLAMAFCSLHASGKKPEPHQNPLSYSPANVIRLAPISLFYGGTGLGLSYERFIDRAQRISFHLPVYAGLRNYLIGNYTNRTNVENNYSMLVNPGIRLYPRGHGGRVVYAIGPSAFLSYGTENGYKQENANYFNEYSKGTETRIGSMINNSFTFNISRKINIGLEAGIGVSLYTNLKNNTMQTSRRGLIEPMGLFAFQVGYKF